MKLLFAILTSALVSGCATQPPSDRRAMITATLEQLNSAENSSLEIGLEQKISAVGLVMSDNWEGWSNGAYLNSREARRDSERALFGMFPDYQRSFELMIVEPPYANVLWTITGTAATNGYKMRMQGSTTFEFDDDGKVIKSWVYTGQMPARSELGIEPDDG